MPPLVSLALATLVSEDLACIAAGVMIADGRLNPFEGTVACLLGIFVGDMLLFLMGRFVPRGLLTRWIDAKKLQSASAWIERRGLAVVLLSRFTPGLRLPTYVTAGLLHSRFWAFFSYFLLAAALWTPVLVAGTAAIGDQALQSLVAQDRPALAMAALGAALYGLRTVGRFEPRRRAIGFLKRKFRWEFWPMWAVYLPLAPYFLYLAVRHRSLTMFTAANPGIPSSGLIGESKAAILGHLSRIDGAVPDYVLISSSLGASARVTAARSFMADRGIRFPVVLKPDVGERGSGVVIARNECDLATALRPATRDTIVQRYASGDEFSLYYVRRPDEARGRVLYVTHKVFPSVIGDGVTSLRDLILRDSRAVCLAKTYFRAARRPLDESPASGIRVPLIDVGSHCRGAAFYDGSHLITAALTTAADTLSHAHPGFHIGRYDVRAASPEALSRGEFQVIELNGVSAETTHVYDPAVGLIEAYRAMGRHWRTACEIGAMNRKRGHAPMTPRELLRLVLSARAN